MKRVKFKLNTEEKLINNSRANGKAQSFPLKKTVLQFFN